MGKSGTRSGMPNNDDPPERMRTFSRCLEAAHLDVFGTRTPCACPVQEADAASFVAGMFGTPNIVDNETSWDCDMLHECASRLRFEAEAAALAADKLRP